MPHRDGARPQRRAQHVTRLVLLLAGLIVTGLLIDCAASPQSLGITGPGNQQKSAGGRQGTKFQHDQPYL